MCASLPQERERASLTAASFKGQPQHFTGIKNGLSLVRCEQEEDEVREIEEEVPIGRVSVPQAMPRYSEADIKFRKYADGFMKGLNPTSRTSEMAHSKSAERFKTVSKDARMNKVSAWRAVLTVAVCRYCRVFSSR